MCICVCKRGSSHFFSSPCVTWWITSCACVYSYYICLPVYVHAFACPYNLCACVHVLVYLWVYMYVVMYSLLFVYVCISYEFFPL